MLIWFASSITAGTRRLRVTIQAARPVTFTERKVEYNGNAFTRVEAQTTVEGESKISLRITPETP